MISRADGGPRAAEKGGSGGRGGDGTQGGCRVKGWKHSNIAHSSASSERLQWARITTSPPPHTDAGQAAAEPCVRCTTTPSKLVTFRETGLGPGCDMLWLAARHKDLSWGAIENWLSHYFTNLRFAMASSNFKNLRVKLSQILAGIQTSHLALHEADTAAAFGSSKDHADMWAWQANHHADTWERRASLFAWFCMAARMPELMGRWAIDDKGKESVLTEQLRALLGFNLEVKGELDQKHVSRLQHAIDDMPRRKSGNGSIFTLHGLAAYLRRAALALPGEIGLHRALSGHLVGQKSSDGKWLVDRAYVGNDITALVIPDWDGASPAIAYLQDGAVVALYNPRGITHERPKQRSRSNWIDEHINWKRKPDDEAAEGNAGCKALPEFDITRVALRAAEWRRRLPEPFSQEDSHYLWSALTFQPLTQ
jgi:hypothetical protein